MNPYYQRDHYYRAAQAIGVHPILDPEGKNASGQIIEQNPHELAECCAWLKDRQVERYLEIGLGSGGLMRFMDEVYGMEMLYGADIREVPTPARAQVYTGDTHKLSFREWCKPLPRLDLVWIDADHRYESVCIDYSAAFLMRPRFMAFHDICGLRDCEGAAEFWRQIKNIYPGNCVEFIHTDHPTRAGIGIWAL